MIAAIARGLHLSLDERDHLFVLAGHPEVGLPTFALPGGLGPRPVQSLLVYTATPGTESHEKLQLLTVIGLQNLRV